MEEGRKRVLGMMASILAARKLAQYDGGKRVPATITAIADAVRWAEEIMKEVDCRLLHGCRMLRIRLGRPLVRTNKRGKLAITMIFG